MGMFESEAEGAFVVLRITSDPDTGRTLVIEGELDASTVAPVEAAVDELLAVPEPLVRVDARRVTFIDSQGIRALLVAHERAERDGVALVVEPASPVVQRLLRLAGVPWLLDRPGAAAPDAGNPAEGAPLQGSTPGVAPRADQGDDR
jgi:anti-sigma B factor antagonist